MHLVLSQLVPGVAGDMQAISTKHATPFSLQPPQPRYQTSRRFFGGSSASATPATAPAPVSDSTPLATPTSAVPSHGGCVNTSVAAENGDMKRQQNKTEPELEQERKLVNDTGYSMTDGWTVDWYGGSVDSLETNWEGAWNDDCKAAWVDELWEGSGEGSLVLAGVATANASPAGSGCGGNNGGDSAVISNIPSDDNSAECTAVTDAAIDTVAMRGIVEHAVDGVVDGLVVRDLGRGLSNSAFPALDTELLLQDYDDVDDEDEGDTLDDAHHENEEEEGEEEEEEEEEEEGEEKEEEEDGEDGEEEGEEDGEEEEEGEEGEVEEEEEEEEEEERKKKKKKKKKKEKKKEKKKKEKKKKKMEK